MIYLLSNTLKGQQSNSLNAIIAPEKLRDYLLNPEHRRGGSKAKKLLTMGYQPARWLGRD